MIDLAGGDDVLGLPGEKSRHGELGRGRRRAAGRRGVDAVRVRHRAGRARDRGGRASTLAPLGARVVAVDASAYFSRPGPRLVDGIELLGPPAAPRAGARAARGPLRRGGHASACRGWIARGGSQARRTAGDRRGQPAAVLRRADRVRELPGLAGRREGLHGAEPRRRRPRAPGVVRDRRQGRARCPTRSTTATTSPGCCHGSSSRATSRTSTGSSSSRTSATAPRSPPTRCGIDPGIWMPGKLVSMLTDQVMQRSVDDLKTRVEAGGLTAVARTVLILHSSAGLYGADVQLLAIARGLDPERWRAVCVLPERGELAPLLEEAGAGVVVRPGWPCCAARLANPAGAVRLARAVRADRRELGALARAEGAAVVHDNTSVILSGGAVARRGGRGAPGPRARDLHRRGRVGRRRAVAADAPADAAGRRGRVHLRRGRGAVRRAPTRRRDPRRAAARAGRRPRGARRGSARGARPTRSPSALVGRRERLEGAGRAAARARRPGAGRDRRDRDRRRRRGPGRGRRRRARRARARARRRPTGCCGSASSADVDAVLGAADALVVPSKRPEPLGLVALEAAAAGLPVVASNAGGVVEAVRDGEDRGCSCRPATRPPWPPRCGRSPTTRPGAGARRRGTSARRRALRARADARPSCRPLYDRIAQPTPGWSAEAETDDRPRPPRRRRSAPARSIGTAGGTRTRSGSSNSSSAASAPPTSPPRWPADRDPGDREGDQQVQPEPEPEAALHQVHRRGCASGSAPRPSGRRSRPRRRPSPRRLEQQRAERAGEQRDEVDDAEAQAPDGGLDQPAEHVEREHVEEQVDEAGVEEAGGDQAPVVALVDRRSARPSRR